MVRLAALSQEDLYLLLHKVVEVYALGDASKHLLPEQGIASFMEHCSRRVGDTYFRTPRTTITAFVNLLAVLEQNPGTAWEELLGGIALEVDNTGVEDGAVETETGDGDGFATFKL